MVDPCRGDEVAGSATIRDADPADIDFLAQIDLRVDSDTGETYHLEWGAAQRRAHRERIAWFVDHPDGIASVGEVPDAGAEARVAMLLARVRELDGDGDNRDREMFVGTLWPLLPSGWVPSDGRFLEVFQLWVDPRHRRRGIASKLKQRLDGVARSRGLELIYTHTRANHAHVIPQGRAS